MCKEDVRIGRAKASSQPFSTAGNGGTLTAFPANPNRMAIVAGVVGGSIVPITAQYAICAIVGGVRVPLFVLNGYRQHGVATIEEYGDMIQNVIVFLPLAGIAGNTIVINELALDTTLDAV